MRETLIRDVSDTARWVAAYRAWESRRPDALFRDPLAERLAGELGERIAQKMADPQALSNGWPIIARTKIIDDYVLSAIAEGCDMVVNLAAGLDTRPYRLDLPKTLRWIEVDLPPMVEFKDAELAGESPRCELSREALDLADAALRTDFLERVAPSAQKLLVISEGLLVYLEPDDVLSLAKQIHGLKSLFYWVAEIASQGVIDRINRRSGGELARAPMKFAPANGIAYFEDLGFRADSGKSLFKEGARLRRVPLFMRPFAWLPDANPRSPGKRPWSWVMRLERNS
jgi:methyltransferase (TIGR00027 family)